MRIIFCGIAVILAVAAWGQFELLDVSLDVLTNSKYIGRGVEVVSEPVRQVSLNVARGSWLVGVWGNQELSKVNSYYGNSTGEGRVTEWDTSLCYNGAAWFGSYCIGYIYYDFPNTGAKSTSEIYLSATADLPLNPTLSVYRDLSAFHGTYVTASFSHESKPFKFLDGREANVSVEASIGYGDGSHNEFNYGNRRNGLTDGSLAVTLNVEGDRNSSFYVTTAYCTLLDQRHLSGEPNRTNLTFGGGFVVRF